ncbi:MAG: flippase [Ignavibacteriaceae bacterium]|nr:flippase [Ignavibacteriaceae bacterium]
MKINILENRLNRNIVIPGFLELSAKLIALVTNIILARVLGVELFGLIGTAFALASFLILFVNWGFDTTGTRRIAINSNSASQFSGNVIVFRAVVSLIISVVLIAFLFFTPDSSQNVEIYLLAFLIVLRQSFGFIYYFNGVQKLTIPAIANLITATVSLTGVIVFVRDNSDIFIALIVQLIATVISILYSFYIFKKALPKFKLNFNKKILFEYFREATPVSVSSFFILFYYSANILILSYLSNTTEAGYFNAANRLYLAGIMGLTLIYNAFFPVLSSVIESKIDFIKSFRKYALYMIIFALIVAFFFVQFNDVIITAVYGEKYFYSSKLLSYFGVSLLIVAIAIICNNTLLIFGKNKHFMIITGFAALLNTGLCFLLIPELNSTGAVLSILFTEIFVASISLIYLYRLFKVRFGNV